MKNLQSIDYEIKLPNLKKSGSYLLDKTVINDHCSLVSAIGEIDSKKDKEEVISYLVFTRPVKGIQAGRTIDIAFTLNVGEDGKYDFKPSKYPYISVYFPTETESKLKFIVQGPYRTTPNRSSVPADDKDNIELAKQTAAWDYEQRIDAQINRLVDLRSEINAAIESMENPEERLLLKYRYLKNESWEDISYELNVSYRTVHRIHASSLNNFVVPE